MALRKIEKTADQVANENSFANIAARWLEHWQGGKSPRHVDSTRRRLDSNILPSLGTLQISQIQAPDVVTMVRTIEARGARDVAKRAMETTGQIFRYAISHGYAKRNPARDFRPSDILKAARKVNYARIDTKELPHLLKQIEVYPGTHVTRFAIKLMALTFVRTSELIDWCAVGRI
jgi:integrase